MQRAGRKRGHQHPWDRFPNFEPLAAWTVEPGKKRLAQRRYFNARNVREHGGIVPPWSIGRSETGARLLLEDGDPRGAGCMLNKRRERIEGGRSGADKGNGCGHSAMNA